MQYYLIRGTQQDDEHEYRIWSVVKRSYMEYVCAKSTLIEDHTFESDGQTIIKLKGFDTITKAEYDTLIKLNLT